MKENIELVDHFAGLAMQAMVSSVDDQDNLNRLRGHARLNGMSLSEFIADDSYKQAIAMINNPRRKRYINPPRPSGGLHVCG